MESKLISARQAAAIIGISPVRVRQLMQRHQLPGEKIAGVWLVAYDAARRFVRRRVGRPRGT